MECGEKKQIFLSTSFGEKRQKAKDVAVALTAWLAENPYLYDIKLSADLNCIRNDFNRSGSTKARNVTLKYSVADKPCNRQYGVAHVYTYRTMFTFNPKKVYDVRAEMLVQEWCEKNPDLKVESWTGGRVTCNTNGVYYELYALIVYSKEVSDAL